MHLTNEALLRKVRKVKEKKSKELDLLAKYVGEEYQKVVGDETVLGKLLEASPYRYLDALKIGSRPAKRKSKSLSTKSLRAIPWVLCWTQSRLLFPAWWGVGTAWERMNEEQKEKLKKLYSESFFYSSFVKSLGFTLAKVVRDKHEADRFINKVETAKTEKPVKSTDMFKRAQEKLKDGQVCSEKPLPVS